MNVAGLFLGLLLIVVGVFFLFMVNFDDMPGVLTALAFITLGLTIFYVSV